MLDSCLSRLEVLLWFSWCLSCSISSWNLYHGALLLCFVLLGEVCLCRRLSFCCLASFISITLGLLGLWGRRLWICLGLECHARICCSLHRRCLFLNYFARLSLAILFRVLVIKFDLLASLIGHLILSGHFDSQLMMSLTRFVRIVWVVTVPFSVLYKYFITIIGLILKILFNFSNHLSASPIH